MMILKKERHIVTHGALYTIKWMIAIVYASIRTESSTILQNGSDWTPLQLMMALNSNSKNDNYTFYMYNRTKRWKCDRDVI